MVFIFLTKERKIPSMALQGRRLFALGPIEAL
jgi:hypothetical protein